MQTALAEFIRTTESGREAEAILRACVHCGFCNATCPTYQLLGDELDGPRGRIYLIKQALEGARPTRRTQRHLDRCLTCRACETTCPSGVRYGRLLDIGREVVERQVRRSLGARLMRALVRAVVGSKARFTPLLRLGQFVRPLLPGPLARAVPVRRRAKGAWPAPRHARRMLVLDGCVQPAVAPTINIAAARVLDRLGISLMRAPTAGCCGALSHHNADPGKGLAFARRNIDAWWPHVDAGVEAIVTTASGCGVHVKDYGHLLRHDPVYAAKAERVARLSRDIVEVVASEDLTVVRADAAVGSRVAFHSPCTLQHGSRLHGVVEDVFARLGVTLLSVPDAHLCCGAAGSYALLQRRLARSLRERKITALHSGRPEIIVTANIGCLLHLESAARVPVHHWIELVADRLTPE